MTLFYNSERDKHIEQTALRWFSNDISLYENSALFKLQLRRQRAVVSGQRPLHSETKPEQSEEKQIDLLTFFHMAFQIN